MRAIIKYILLVVIYANIHQVSLGQARPYINSISPTIANVGETVTIVGSGFPTNTANLQVTFGGVAATVTSNSSTLIEVTVPSAASYDEIMVTDKASGLSGSSSDFFMISYGGDAMSPLSQTVFQTLFQVSTPLDISLAAGQTQTFPYDLCLCDFDQDGKQDVVVTAQENPSGGRAKRVVFRNTSTVTSLNMSPVLELRNQPSSNVNCKDLDGDGKPDLVVSEINVQGVDSGEEEIEVYLNTSSSGNISFSGGNEPTLRLALPRDQAGDLRDPARIELEDIDQDGKPDIISSTNNDNNLDIYLNTSTVGSLSFANSSDVVQTPDVDHNATAFKVADLNNDGLKDILLAARGASQIYTIENQSTSGEINFKDPQLISITGQVFIQNLEIANINEDAFPEIILSDGDGNSGELIVIENTTAANAAAISFGTTLRFDTENGPWGLSVGDIDGDQKVDIAVAASNATAFNVLINQSSTSQIDFKIFSLNTTNNSRNLKIVDINGDVKPDILAITGSRTQTPGKLSVYLNRNCVTPRLTPTSDIYCPGTSFIIEATPAEQTTFNFEVSTDGGNNWTSRQNTTSNTYDLGSDAANTTNLQVRVTANSNDGRCTTTSSAATINLNTVTPNYGSFSATAPSNICIGSDLNLSTTVTADSYFWSGPNGFSSNDQNPVLSSVEAAAAGTYELVIQNDGGCKSSPATAQVNIITTPAPNFTNTGDDDFCVGGQTSLETTAFDGFTRQWNLNGSAVSGETGTTLTVDATGVYSLSLTTVVGNLTCTTTGESLEINEVERPTATIQAENEICTEVPFEFNSTINGSSQYNFTYAWDVQDATNSSVGNGSADSLEVTFANAGVYTANLIVGYELVSNCTNTVTQDVTASSPPNLDINASTLVKCPTDTVTLEMPAGLDSYLWSTGDTTQTSIAVTPEGVDTVTVDVTVVTNIGCTVYDTLQVTNFDDGGITITSVDTNIPIVNQALNIPSGVLSIQLQANGGTSYEWTPATIFDDPAGSQVTVRPRSVETDIILTGIDINSCLESDSLRMINDNVQARKSFSPNGDGLGFECWEILNSSTLNGCTLYILDKRGRTIFQADTPFEGDCAWNGIDVDGKQAPEGVYYYVLKCSETDFNRTGNLLLGR